MILYSTLPFTRVCYSCADVTTFLAGRTPYTTLRVEGLTTHKPVNSSIYEFCWYLPINFLSLVFTRPPSRRKVSSSGLNVHFFLSALRSGFSGLREPILC